MQRLHYIRLSTGCNQNCLFCNVRGSQPVLAEPRPEILSELSADLDAVVLTGGEPLMARSLAGFLRTASELGLAVEIQTNGTLLAAGSSLDLLDRFPPRYLVISLNAHEPALYQRLCRTDYFEHAVEGIRRAVAHGHRVRLEHLLCGLNYERAGDFARLVIERLQGVESVGFLSLIPAGQALEREELFVRHSQVMRSLEPAVDTLIQAGQDVSLAGPYGFPLCLVPERHRALSECMQHLHPNPCGVEIGDERCWAEECRDCHFRPICAGLWKGYASRFGLGELAPRSSTIRALPRIDCAIDPQRIGPYREAMQMRESLETSRGQYFVWALTAECNTHCRFCDQRQYFRPGDHGALSRERCLALADDLARWRFDDVLLCGGEPTLHPHLDEILDALHARGLRTSLNTNGILLDPGRIQRLAESGLENLIVSLDADRAAVHDDLRRRPGLFDHLIETLEAVRDEPWRPSIRLHAIVSAANFSHLLGLVELAAQLGLESVDMTLFMDIIKQEPAFKLSRAQILRFYKQILPEMARSASGLHIKLHLNPTPLRWASRLSRMRPEDLQELENLKLEDRLLDAWAECRYNVELNQSYVCLSSWFDKYMDPYGELYPCSQSSIFQSEYRMGNIQAKPFDELMNSKAIREFRRRVPDHGACQRCFAASVAHAELIKFLPSHEDVIDARAYFEDNLNEWSFAALGQRPSEAR
ncbi:MAG: radical SAM protein [Deltaproteobacteria bacterium]|nr:radical SAM protein [Deltaproteobacteria bacterium]